MSSPRTEPCSPWPSLGSEIFERRTDTSPPRSSPSPTPHSYQSDPDSGYERYPPVAPVAPRPTTPVARPVVAEKSGQNHATGPRDSVPEERKHDGTPRSVRLGTKDLNVDPKAKGYYTRIANEEMGYQYAWMPTDAWIARFLPGASVPQDIVGGQLSKIPYIKVECDYYPPLYEFSKTALDSRSCGGKYFMPFTGDNPEKNSKVDTKPDFCIYEKDGPGADTFTIKTSTPKDTSSSAGQPTTAGGADCDAEALDETQPTPTPVTPESVPATDAKGKGVLKPEEKSRPLQAHVSWPWVTAFIEVKHNASWVAYDVKDDKLILPQTDNAKKARSQIIKYVAEILSRQHRQFVLCALIVKQRAFLMRWDRTGAIVAKPFDYIAEPEKLAVFLYRIALADKSAQGYDPTATLASPEEIRRFEAYRDSYALSNLDDDPGRQALLRYMNDILSPENQRLHPIYKVICSDPDASTEAWPGQAANKPEGPAKGPTSVCPDVDRAVTTGLASAASEAEDRAETLESMKTRAFLVGLPRHATRSPTGRGGKGFVAYDLDNAPGRCVFLKDYWYALGESVHPETEVYKKLNASGVQFVATLVVGGDVGSSSALQETLTQEHLPEEGRPCVRRHHRFVVKEIGRPLETYGRDIDLYEAVFSALIAHRDAWEKAHILHRDVSMGNILINVETGTGFLNDWDLCKYKDEIDKPASQHVRSGTWPYMSAALLNFPRKPNELADDLESFVYVISLAILRFHTTTFTLNLSINKEPLASYIGTVFNEAYKTMDGYWRGGTRKLTSLRNGDPGFDLVDKTSNLSLLLDTLWALGQNHYANLDLKYMQARWGAGRIVEEPHHQANLDDLDNPIRLPRVAAKSFRGHLNLPKDFSPVILRQRWSRARQPELGDFTSHDAIFQVFLSLEKGWYAGEDKTRIEDRFVGMEAYGPIRIAQSTGGGGRSSRAMNSTDVVSSSKGVKRNSRPEDCSDAGSTSKRARK